MKKRNLTLALIAMVSAMSLTSCGDSIPLKSDRNGSILTINAADDTTKSIDVDSIFAKTLLTSSGVTAYYNAICEVIIRGTIPVTEEITRKATNSVESLKQEAESNAETNDSNYDDELETLLSGQGVDDLEELHDKYVYDQLREDAYDKFFDEKADELLGDYIDTMVPYHVRHILVNVSASSDDGSYRGNITQQEAKNIAGVVKLLASGQSFGRVAQTHSSDGSASSYGDLGIMTTATSYVPEFKLGLYAFDALVNKTATVTDRVSQFNMTEEAEDYFGRNLINTVNYSDILEMERVAEIEKDSAGNPVNSGNANYYPRNVYFNQYINKHNASIIINDTASAGFKLISEIPELSGVEGLDQTKYALVTEKGQVILMVRAGSGSADSGYQGVHFIVAEKSPIVEQNLNDYYSYNESVTVYGDEDHLGKTYVSFIPNTNAEYRQRMTTIENEVESFDQLMDARIYEEYIDDTVIVNGVEQRKFIINNDIKVQLGDSELTLEDAINTYIENQRDYYASTNTDSMNQAWNEFVEKLEVYDANRSTNKKLLSLVCATDFQNASTSPEYQAGGVCYVAK